MEEQAIKYLFKILGIIISMLVGTSEIDTTSDLPNGEYQVTSVVDGDTIKIDHNGQIKSIRLIGIDTPELHDPRKKVECFAQEAANIVDEKISEHYVYLESDNSQDDKDKYSRYLRYVFLDDKTNLNLWLVENGFAYEYTYDVPYVYQTDFVQAEDDARQNNVGLWDPKTCDGER